MLVDKKGREMFSEEDYQIDFVGTDASTPNMRERKTKSVKIAEDVPPPDPLSEQFEFVKGDELNGVKLKINTKILLLS